MASNSTTTTTTTATITIAVTATAMDGPAYGYGYLPRNPIFISPSTSLKSEAQVRIRPYLFLYGKMDSVEEVYHRATVAFPYEYKIMMDMAQYYVQLHFYPRARHVYAAACARNAGSQES
jgi:hypothetical protein